MKWLLIVIIFNADITQTTDVSAAITNSRKECLEVKRSMVPGPDRMIVCVPLRAMK